MLNLPFPQFANSRGIVLPYLEIVYYYLFGVCLALGMTLWFCPCPYVYMMLCSKFCQPSTLCVHIATYLVAFQFRSSFEIKKVKVPTLFLSGLADQLIPSTMMMELYQVFTGVVILNLDGY